MKENKAFCDNQTILIDNHDFQNIHFALLSKTDWGMKGLSSSIWSSCFQDLSEYLNTITLEHQRNEVLMVIIYVVQSYFSRWHIFSQFICLFLILRVLWLPLIRLKCVYATKYVLLETCNGNTVHIMEKKSTWCVTYTQGQCHALWLPCLNNIVAADISALQHRVWSCAQFPFLQSQP